MPFLHCARDVFVGDLARQLVMASEGKAGDKELCLGSKKTIYEALGQTLE
jgi:hypothetical protein